MKQIAQGAEAIIYEDRGIIKKERIKKSYRHPDIDLSLRKFRTNREAKILKKLEEIKFPAPKLLRKENFTLTMEKIEGEILKKNFNIYHAEEIGKLVGILHKNNIIHGDLTTSNMISTKKNIYFIDFGLSQISIKQEDKAVDLHLLKQALESKHYKEADEAFVEILAAYEKEYPEKEILTRLVEVEKRGRNKGKGN